MAAETLRSLQGDTLDALLWRERGLGPDDLADVLAANPGLADRGAVLPIGTAVLVPAARVRPVVPTRDLIQLWD